MNRRDFFKALAATSTAFSVVNTIPFSRSARAQSAAGQRSGSLVSLCRDILLQNLLKPGETFVIATPHIYNHEYISAMLEAASEIGAVGAHIAVIPKVVGRSFDYGLTAWHWDLYASADLLITTRVGAPPGVPAPATSYIAKVGNHNFRTDHEYINRPGAKTRWLDLSYPPHLQRQYFPTPERTELTLKGAKIMHDTREIRITSEAGSEFTVRKEGRPGHAQYGIADAPGRWDNFGYGCVACGPEENSAEGTLVLEPGDIIPDLRPYQILTEQIKLTFKGGYVTRVEGGAQARRFEALLASFNDKEAYGISHVGYGTHEKTGIGNGTPEEIGHYHHNAIGSLLFSLGRNYGHGLGGPEVKYSGLGLTTRKAPNHTHFAMFRQSFYCDGKKIIERGQLML